MILLLLISIILCLISSEECNGIHSDGTLIEIGNCISATDSCSSGISASDLCAGEEEICCAVSGAGEAAHASEQISEETSLKSSNSRLFDCYLELWNRVEDTEPIIVRFLPYFVFDDSSRSPTAAAAFLWASHDGTLSTDQEIPSFLGSVGDQLSGFHPSGYENAKMQEILDVFSDSLHRFSGRRFSLRALSYERTLLVPLSRYRRGFLIDDPVGDFFRNENHQPDWSRLLTWCPSDVNVARGSFEFQVNLNHQPTPLSDGRGVTLDKLCSANYGFARCSYAAAISTESSAALLPAGVRSFVHEIAHGLFGLSHDRCSEMTHQIHTEYGGSSIMGLGFARDDQADRVPKMPILARASQALMLGYLSNVHVASAPGEYRLEPWDLRVDANDGEPVLEDASFLLEVSLAGSKPGFVLLISFDRYVDGLPLDSPARSAMEIGALHITYHEAKSVGFQRSGTLVDTTVRSRPRSHSIGVLSDFLARECNDGALLLGRQFRIDDLDLIIHFRDLLQAGNAPDVAIVSIERISDTDRLSLCGNGVLDAGEECETGGDGCLEELCQCATGHTATPTHLSSAATYDHQSIHCFKSCGDGFAEYNEQCDSQEGCNAECLCDAAAGFIPLGLGRGCQAAPPDAESCPEGSVVVFEDANDEGNEGDAAWSCIDPRSYRPNDGRIDLSDVCDQSFYPRSIDSTASAHHCSDDNLICTDGGRPRIHIAQQKELSSRWRLLGLQASLTAKPGDRLFTSGSRPVIENRFAPSQYYPRAYGAIGGLEVTGCAPWNGDAETLEKRKAVQFHAGPDSRVSESRRIDLDFWRENNQLSTATEEDNSLLSSTTFIAIIASSACICLLLITALILSCLFLRRRHHRNQKQIRTVPINSSHRRKSSTSRSRAGTRSGRSSPRPNSMYRGIRTSGSELFQL